jgi:hypothetical protein
MRATPAPVMILYRLVAVWMVTLIVLPFTAPFKTFDLGVATVEAGVDGSLAKPVPLPITLAAPSSPQPAAQLEVVRSFAGGSDHYRILHTVLRV